MMIPYGYKQTEVGVIPEDWELLLLGKTAKVYRGGSPRPIQSYITNSSNGVNWIKIGDVRENDKYIYSTQEKIRPDGISMSREVHIGDFILSNSMSFGRPYILRTNGCIHDGWLTIQEYGQAFSTEYLYYLLSSKIIYKQYIGMAAGSSVKNLNKDKVSSLMVICPPLPEQQRIAEALSDVDGMISSLEKLVAKYKSIKTACLQQMFPQNGETVPRMRLPGFTGAWEQRKFEEIAVRSSVICSDDTLPRVEYEDIVSGTGRLNKDIYAKQSSKSGIAFHQGDVLYGKLRPYLQNWLLPTFDGLAVGDFWVLQPQNADSSFLYRLIQSRQFDEVANQSTGTKMPRADWKLVSKTVFSIPSNISEQATIGTYFTALDSLITLHQRKLEKIQKIKQGMMQQLLTGKIRLV